MPPPLRTPGLPLAAPRTSHTRLMPLPYTLTPQVRVPFSELLVWQKVNHFPEAKQLTRKDLLKRHLVRYQVWGLHTNKGFISASIGS